MSRVFSGYDVTVEKSENLNGSVSDIYEGPGAKKIIILHIRTTDTRFRSIMRLTVL